MILTVCVGTDSRGKVKQATTKQTSGEHVSHARHYTSQSLSLYILISAAYALSVKDALISTCAIWAIVYRDLSSQQQSQTVAELSRQLLNLHIRTN